MVRVVGKHQRIENQKAEDRASENIHVQDFLSYKQSKDVAKKILQFIAITVAEHPSKIIALLQKFGIQVSTKPKSNELVKVLIDNIAKNDDDFNAALGTLIHENIPNLPPIEEHDSFNPSEDIAKTVGKSAGGAVSGGWMGAALGVVSGGLGLANSAQQAKTEKAKASAMTMSSLLHYKSTQEQSRGSNKSSKTKITIAIVSLVGLIGGGILLYVLTRPNPQVKPLKQGA
jgi:sulfur relay (sulfurtransferase) DsrC/TusE family protein